MNLKTLIVGELRTNCYIIEKGNSCIIIDPGAEAEIIMQNLNPNKKIVGIFVTHSHDDHIGAVRDLLAKYTVPIYSIANLKEGLNKIENFDINVIYTPGHKDDCITFYFEQEKVMFCGDFIFKDGIGRIDLEDASPLDMKLSIEKILQYPDEITLCPGHGPMTTLGAEKENLKYFKVAI